VAARINALAAELGVQEVAILTPCHDAEARAESYRLIAREFGMLESRAAA
jgi:hypothetical protein